VFWWLGALIIIGAIAVAILLGYFLGTIISRRWAWPFHPVHGRIDRLIYPNELPRESGGDVFNRHVAYKKQVRLTVKQEKTMYQPVNAKSFSDKQQIANFNQIKESGNIHGNARKVTNEASNKVCLAQEQVANEKTWQQAEEILKAKAETDVARLNLRESSQKETNHTVIFGELRENLKIAAAPQIQNPKPFYTDALKTCFASQDTSLSDMIVDLKEAYTDIILANSIVWLVTEMGTSNKTVEDTYMKLCGNIAERLTGVLQRMSELKE
jgi:hypothetical protein